MGLYLTVKKIHRLTIWPVVVLGLIQIFSGLSLKYGWGTAWLFDWHSQLSLIFAGFFLVQLITGLLMYFLPLIPPKPDQVL